MTNTPQPESHPQNPPVNQPVHQPGAVTDSGPRPKAWKTIVAILLFVIAGIFLLANIARIALPGASASGGGDPAYMLGQLIGAFIMIGIPIIIGVLLLRSNSKARKAQLARGYQGPGQTEVRGY